MASRSPLPVDQRRSNVIEAVVVGASAGALEALTHFLISLPAELSIPIIGVVHLARDSESLLVECLRHNCHRDVKEAEDKELICEGRVYFAPSDYHLLVENDRRLSLSYDAAVQFSRPSIDVLFESAADVYGAALIGVILTGANSDGAKGLRAIMDAGGRGLVQRPELAMSSAMPLAALRECPDAIALSIPQMAEYFQEAVLAK